MSKIALIAGASGMVGGHCLQLLLKDSEYSKVVSIGRRQISIKDEKLEQIVVDFDKLEEHADLFTADHIYCCLGTTIKKAKTKEQFKKVDLEYPLKMAGLAADNNAMCFSIITSLGASQSSPFFYSKVKGEVEDILATLNIPCINILQPSILYGDRGESRIGEKIGIFGMKAVGSLFVGGLKKYKGISGEQVALAMVSVTKEERKGLRKFPSNELQDY